MSAFTTHLPEPNDLLAVFGVVPVDGVALPVVNVHLLHAAQHQLQFPLVEVLEPLQWHHFIETVQEGLGLVLDASRHAPVGHQTKTKKHQSISY